MTSTIKLVAFDQEGAARLLVEYLNSENIPAHFAYHPDEFAYQVLLDDLSMLEQAKQCCQEFLANPNSAKFRDLAWGAEPVIQMQNSSLGLPKFNLHSLATAPITWLILVCCLVVYLINLSSG